MTCGHDDSTINIVMGIIIIIITTTTVQNSTIQDQDSNPRDKTFQLTTRTKSWKANTSAKISIWQFIFTEIKNTQ